MPPTATKPSATGKAQAAPARRPFIAGTVEVDRPYYDESKTMTTGTSKLPIFSIPTNGFLRTIYVWVTLTAAGNSATVALTEGGIFSAIDTVVLNDTNNRPLFGPFSGEDWRITNKYGGYRTQDDPKMDGEYFALTGSGATAGSGDFVVRVPIEIRQRDGALALPNKNNAALYKLEMTVGASTAVYSTPPTALPAVRVRATIESWDDPIDADAQGRATVQNPPGVQGTQYWSKNSLDLSSGAFDKRIESFDGYLRNMIFVWRGQSDKLRVTGEGYQPDPITVTIEGKQTGQYTLRQIRRRINEDYGYGRATGAATTAVVTPDTAGARDYGVHPMNFTRDWGMKPGNEVGLAYIPVSAATSIEISGTTTGAVSLDFLVNRVVPRGGDITTITGR